MMKPKVFNFTSRLPGPMAAYLFAEKNLEVFKCENLAFPDPFKDRAEPLFNYWYNNFIRKQKVIQGDDLTLAKEIHKNLGPLNIFLVPKFEPIKQLLRPIASEHRILYLRIAGGIGEEKNMHDLNALASTEVFKLHLDQSMSPPFVPLAGVTFAQEIVSNALIWTLELNEKKPTMEKTIYLSDSTKTVLGPLYGKGAPDDRVFLHNGKFPCYSLYSAQDCFIAVAAVEEKFWKQFVDAFALNLSVDDRLSTKPEVKEIVHKSLLNYKRQDLEKMPLASMCLTLIDK